MDDDGTRLSVESGTEKSEPSPIPEGLEPALRELESYLDGEPRESLSRHVLVLASTWVLGDAGFDLDRYYAEAKTFYDVAVPASEVPATTLDIIPAAAVLAAPNVAPATKPAPNPIPAAAA